VPADEERRGARRGWRAGAGDANWPCAPAAGDWEGFLSRRSLVQAVMDRPGTTASAGWTIPGGDREAVDRALLGARGGGAARTSSDERTRAVRGLVERVPGAVVRRARSARRGACRFEDVPRLLVEAGSPAWRRRARRSCTSGWTGGSTTCCWTSSRTPRCEQFALLRSAARGTDGGDGGGRRARGAVFIVGDAKQSLYGVAGRRSRSCSRRVSGVGWPAASGTSTTGCGPATARRQVVRGGGERRCSAGSRIRTRRWPGRGRGTHWSGLFQPHAAVPGARIGSEPRRCASGRHGSAWRDATPVVRAARRRAEAGGERILRAGAGR
jgi:hypothetical protein